MHRDKIRTTVEIPAAAVQFPLVRSEGPKVRLSNEQTYEHVEFP